MKNRSETWTHVVTFAFLMEQKLAANRHKGNRPAWLKAHPYELLDKLKHELDELTEALESRDPKAVELECADIANFAMMIADNYNHNAKTFPLK